MATFAAKDLFPWGRLFCLSVVLNLAPFPLADIIVPQFLGWWQNFGRGSFGRRLVASWSTIGTAYFVLYWIDRVQPLLFGSGDTESGFPFQGNYFDDKILLSVLLAFGALVVHATLWFLCKAVGLRAEGDGGIQRKFSISDGLVLMTGIAIALGVLKNSEALFVELGRPSLDLPETVGAAPWLQIGKLGLILLTAQFGVCLAVTFPITLFRLYGQIRGEIAYWLRVSLLGLIGLSAIMVCYRGEWEIGLIWGLLAVVFGIAWPISWVSKIELKFKRNRIPVSRMR